MPEGEGAILIRGAEEPASLESPTTIAGTNDGGAISDGVFSSPPIFFEREVTAAGITTVVEITATFTEVTPGSVDGSINDTGSLALDLDLRVDLDIFVDVLNSTFHCVASPVAIELQSVAPYDPADGGSVVLEDGNFSVPAVPVTDDCVEIVANGVNDELAGSGHSLTVPMTGAITVPVFPGELTDTALVVDPVESDQGDPVTLTATVIADPEGNGVGTPTGTVDFLDGTTVVGSASLSPEGVAVLTTSDLSPGNRRLRATYRGVPETWDDSTSALVIHRVSATPLLSADVPASVEIGGSAVDLQLAVTNTGLGSPLSGLDLVATLKRPEGDSTIAPDGGTPRIVLSRVVEGVATPVALTVEGSPPDETLTGTVLVAGSWELAAGAERLEDLRLQVSGATDPGPLQVTFSLVRPGSGGGEPETIASSSGQIAMVPANRVASTVAAGDDFFFPPIVPTAARQGSILDVNQLRVDPIVGGRSATGTFEFFIDGIPAPSRLAGAPSDTPYAQKSPVATGGPAYSVQIPPATPTGTRQVIIRYSGDQYFAPSQVQYPVRIETAVGETYECVWEGTVSYRALLNVQAQASLPAVWPAGTDATIADMDVRLVLARTSSWLSVGSNFEQPDQAEQEFNFGLGPDGVATADSVVSQNFFPREFEDGSDIDHTITFGGITGSVSVDGAPGEVVDVTLDSIDVDVIRDVGVTFGSFTITCTPVGEAIVLDRVTAAGTSLAVAPAGPVAAGTPVTLTATTLPAAAGSVEFRDGTTTIGVVPVGATGVATLVTDELASGRRSLTAIYRPAALGPVTRSEPVELRVVGDCSSATQVEPGNGAVVRLVYIELLGRCPDQAGYTYWKGRLDGGTSQEVFARTIARTAEAVGMVVDDAYATMLGRAPDTTGRAFWTTRLQGHGRYDQLLADLAASAEFWDLAGETNIGFVTRVYDRLLHRSPDQPGLDHWVGRLEAGTSRRALVLTLTNQDEPLGVLVGGSYDEILDRVPDADERADGISHLRSTGDRSGLYAQLIGLPEFNARAQEFPDLT